MEESILIAVKKLLGIAEEYTEFDLDICMGINSAFSVLKQLGVDVPKGFIVEDETTDWSDAGIDKYDFEAIKCYIAYKTRLTFDPPTSNAVLESLKAAIAELEYRINVQVD